MAAAGGDVDFEQQLESALAAHGQAASRKCPPRMVILRQLPHKALAH